MQFYFVPELGVTLNDAQIREYRKTGVSPFPTLTAAHEATVEAKAPVVVPIVSDAPVETPIEPVSEDPVSNSNPAGEDSQPLINSNQNKYVTINHTPEKARNAIVG